MFGFGTRDDTRTRVRKAHARHYRRAVGRSTRAAAYARAIREVLAERIRARDGVIASERSPIVAAEAIPFLLLPPGRSLEALEEYLAWQEGSDERIGYLRATLAHAMRTRQPWAPASIRAFSASTLDELGWFNLLPEELQDELREVQTKLRDRALELLAANIARGA